MAIVHESWRLDTHSTTYRQLAELDSVSSKKLGFSENGSVSLGRERPSESGQFQELPETIEFVFLEIN